jgi:hypothetical protein
MFSLVVLSLVIIAYIFFVPDFSEQPHGAVVASSLPHAPCVSVEEGVFLLVLEPNE